MGYSTQTRLGAHIEQDIPRQLSQVETQAAMLQENLEFLEKEIAELSDRIRQLCEELGIATNGMHERNHECAQAIRARGEK